MVYRDMTFCVNEECKNRCSKYLTCEIEEKTKAFGLPLAVASFICLDKGEDGIYQKDVKDESEKMS